jgi:hypothetical protein
METPRARTILRSWNYSVKTGWEKQAGRSIDLSKMK